MNINPKVLDVYKKYFGSKDITNNFSNADLCFYLPNEILHKVDKASMAVGLEARVPFLDHNFVELSTNLSGKYKVNKLQTKYLFKKAMLDTLPKEIIYRKKRGFGVPLKQYFRKELKDFVLGEINTFNFKEFNLNKEHTQYFLGKHFSKQQDYSNFLWALIILKKWSDQWLSQ